MGKLVPPTASVPFGLYCTCWTDNLIVMHYVLYCIIIIYLLQFIAMIRYKTRSTIDLVTSLTFDKEGKIMEK